ncbi:unnamed protein product [Microthlaspi erraticum]|uniref:Piwi domain-containing protein n=1 Tax=Microthlaspi erraticum TaxID=1685480 RepID=A0A6D2IXF1_9BRAS|nr:unnamed protein product [Microthlaspi erraticum]
MTELCKSIPSQGYNPSIAFAVVHKRHHTTRGCSGAILTMAGTVVDSVITHPKEFGFYLCSHFGVKGTSRPTHYHITSCVGRERVYFG